MVVMTGYPVVVVVVRVQAVAVMAAVVVKNVACVNMAVKYSNFIFKSKLINRYSMVRVLSFMVRVLTNHDCTWSVRTFYLWSVGTQTLGYF